MKTNSNLNQKKISSKLLLSELFQENLMDGKEHYFELSKSDKAYATSLFWDLMDFHNEFEPLVETDNSDRLIHLVKLLLKGENYRKIVGESILEIIEDNAIEYLEERLSDYFDQESRIYSFDIENNFDGEI